MNYIFDFGGTLVKTVKSDARIFEDFRRKISKSLRLPIGKVDAAQEFVDKEELPDLFSFDSRIRIRTVEMEREAHWKWFEAIVRRLGVNTDLQFDLLNQLCEMSMTDVERRVFEDSIPCLERIRRSGGNLYILSNGLPSRRLEIENLRLDRYFNKIFVSSEIGLEKPDKKIYEYVLNDLGMMPFNTAFVDDQINCVEAASLLGIKSFRIKRGSETVASQWDISTLDVLENGQDHN